MYEFFKLKDVSQYEPMAQASFEKRLKTDEIEFEVDLPKNNPKERYLGAKPMVFDTEEIEEAKKTKLKGQDITITDGTDLSSVLDEPYKISEKFNPSDLNSFIKNKVLYGDQYRFWEKSNNTLTYYQQFEDKMFYMNLNGELTFYLNEENEIVSYKQTMLEDIEEKQESEKVIQPIKAIETLYKNGSLKQKSKITNVELGYFTWVPLSSSSSSLLLAPAWRFVINGEENLFVHAFEGQIIQLTNEEKKIVE
jgi:regulatory protein YycI of two-component signal transduction system YycFG